MRKCVSDARIPRPLNLSSPSVTVTPRWKEGQPHQATLFKDFKKLHAEGVRRGDAHQQAGPCTPAGARAERLP